MKMNSKYILMLLISLFLFKSCKSESAQTKKTTESTEVIVNSIKEFIETTSPFFDTKYVKTDDGRDLKFIDYIKIELEKSKIEGNDFYLAKALSSFSSIIATLSKEDAKKYGIENKNIELIKVEYQKYLFLSPQNLNSRDDYINIYLNSIRSISFHLKVKNIPVYEDLENLINLISDEISNNKNNLNEAESYKVNLLHCNFLYSIALEKYAKYLIIGVLEKDIPDFPFVELENQRRELMPKVDDFSELSKKLSLLNNSEYSESMNKSSEIIKGYFLIINTGINTILKEEE